MPDNVMSYTVMVTRHVGAWSWVVYHGNDINLAQSLLTSVRSKEVHRDRQQGQQRQKFKLWLCGGSAIEGLNGPIKRVKKGYVRA